MGCMHIHSHDCACRWIFFTKVIAAAHMATPIPTASTITIIHWPSIVHVTWAWLALALKARSPRTTLRTFRTTRSIRLVNRWAKRYKHRNILRGRGLLFFRLVTLRGELFLLFLRRVQGLRFFRNFISRYRRLLVLRLGLLRWRRLGLRGRWRRYDLNALNGVTALAAYLFLNLFRGAAHHFDYHRVLLLVVYLVSYLREFA